MTRKITKAKRKVLIAICQELTRQKVITDLRLSFREFMYATDFQALSRTIRHRTSTL